MHLDSYFSGFVDREVLHLIMEKWNCGSIRPDRSDQTIKFEVRNLGDLLSTVIPHFRANPLMSSKQNDFNKFAGVCELMSEVRHREIDGFEKIVRLSMEMNPSGKRKYFGSELLNSLRSGERIVYAASNRGNHEVPTCTNGVTLAPLSRPETQ